MGDVRAVERHRRTGRDPLLHELPGRGVGFGVTFAKHLADETGRTVLLIPGARGDTSFTPKNGYTWDPFDATTRVNLYHQGVRAIDAVIARYPGSQVAAILWHQGETDVPLVPGDVYQAKLDSLIRDLRSRYGSEIPFLLGGMNPEEMEISHKDYSAVNAVHIDTPNRNPRCAFIPGNRNASTRSTIVTSTRSGCVRWGTVCGPNTVRSRLITYRPMARRSRLRQVLVVVTAGHWPGRLG